MKRVLLAIVTTVTSLVLLLSFKTHSPSAVATPPVAVSGTTNTNSTSTSSTSGTSKKTSTKKTYTGSAAQTRYGPVQVQVTVKKGTVVSADAVVYPTGSSLDVQINSYAIPALNSEAVSAGSASIDMVSGATFTSEGYISSLQSALDQAGL